MRYSYQYPHPAVTTDCVIFGFDGNRLNVLLIERGIEPYKGQWAFPGGFLDEDETLEEAAALTRELNDKYGDYLNAFQNVIEVDIAPKGTSKGEAVSVIRRYYGDCKVYAIGDSMNDLPLLEAADVSYTFHYAPEEVQRKATKVVDTIVDALQDSMDDAL